MLQTQWAGSRILLFVPIVTRPAGDSTPTVCGDETKTCLESHTMILTLHRVTNTPQPFCRKEQAEKDANTTFKTPNRTSQTSPVRQWEQHSLSMREKERPHVFTSEVATGACLKVYTPCIARVHCGGSVLKWKLADLELQSNNRLN